MGTAIVSDVIFGQTLNCMQFEARAPETLTRPKAPVAIRPRSVNATHQDEVITLQRKLAEVTYAFWESCLTPAYDESLSYEESWHTMIDRIEAYFLQHRGCVMAQLLLEGFNKHPATQTRLNMFFVNWRDAFAHVLASRYGHNQAQTIAADSIAQLEGALITLPFFSDASPLTRTCDLLRQLLRENSGTRNAGVDLRLRAVSK